MVQMMCNFVKERESLAFVRRCAREQILREESRESYDWDHNLDASFKAKCCMDSRVEESGKEGGSQIGAPYSKTGRTMVR